MYMVLSLFIAKGVGLSYCFIFLHIVFFVFPRRSRASYSAACSALGSPHGPQSGESTPDEHLDGRRELRYNHVTDLAETLFASGTVHFLSSCITRSLAHLS